MYVPIPSAGSSGNITPQSITIARPAHSIAIRLRPISPNPPKATILTGAVVGLLDTVTPIHPPHPREIISVANGQRKLRGRGGEENTRIPKPHAGFGLPVCPYKIGCGASRLLELKVER